jgi:hypothetical protein
MGMEIGAGTGMGLRRFSRKRAVGFKRTLRLKSGSHRIAVFCYLLEQQAVSET